MEEHRGAVCQLVSVKGPLAPPSSERQTPHGRPRVSALLLQADGLRHPPLLRPQHGGPGGPAHRLVPRRLLHDGRHRRGDLLGALPRGGVDGAARRPAGLHDRHGSGLAAAAGSAQP